MGNSILQQNKISLNSDLTYHHMGRVGSTALYGHKEPSPRTALAHMWFPGASHRVLKAVTENIE